MKNMSIICCVFFIVSCSPKMYSPLISNIPQTEEGTIYLQCSGFGKKEEAAKENAIRNAFNMLLFQGIPASVQPGPMIEPADADKVRPKVESCINDNGCYKNFITQAAFDSPVKVKSGVQVSSKIKINLRSVRTYLEQNKLVARPFNL